jgi:hypothetical protein
MKSKQINGLTIALQNTSSFTDDDVWEAIRHVMQKPRLELIYRLRVNVMVENFYSGFLFRGMCYWNVGPSFPKDDGWCPLIIAKVTSNEKRFPCYAWPSRYGGGYLPSFTMNRMEALIHLLGHEFRHLWQTDVEELEPRQRSRRGYVWGSRGVLSNRDADAFGIHKVRQYRQLYNHKSHYCMEVLE